MTTFENYATLSSQGIEGKIYKSIKKDKPIILQPPRQGSLEKYAGTMSFTASVRPSGCYGCQKRQKIIGVT